MVCGSKYVYKCEGAQYDCGSLGPYLDQFEIKSTDFNAKAQVKNECEEL